jgi:hypothetical protein
VEEQEKLKVVGYKPPPSHNPSELRREELLSLFFSLHSPPFRILKIF